MTLDNERITALLAGMDTVYFSCDLPVSNAMRERLTQEKVIGQARATQRQVQCLEWLQARIAPQGAKGGYAVLIETEDFSVKLLGDHMQNRPSVFIEMRSHALHTHPEGAAGACEAALDWIRTHLYADQFAAARDAISFTAAKICHRMSSAGQGCNALVTLLWCTSDVEERAPCCDARVGVGWFHLCDWGQMHEQLRERERTPHRAFTLVWHTLLSCSRSLAGAGASHAGASHGGARRGGSSLLLSATADTVRYGKRVFTAEWSAV